MKFSTNAKCGGCKAAIINGLQEKFPDARWSLDLESAETAAGVEAAIAETGFKGSWLRQPGY